MSADNSNGCAIVTAISVAAAGHEAATGGR